MVIKIRSALVSVFDKEGIEPIMKEFKRTMLYYINKSPDEKFKSNYMKL